VRFRGASTVGRSRDLRSIHAEHVAVIAALRKRDAALAAERMRKHLLHTAQLLVAQEGGGPHELAWAPLVRVPAAD
jgi:DNA-binding GntR family transcriptional regulator